MLVSAGRFNKSWFIKRRSSAAAISYSNSDPILQLPVFRRVLKSPQVVAQPDRAHTAGLDEDATFTQFVADTDLAMGWV